MLPDATSRYSRKVPRRAVPGEVLVDVMLCDGEAALARVVDEQGGSLGLLMQGAHAERALAHRACCARKPVRLRVPGLCEGEGAEVRGVARDVPAELIHVTALGDTAKAGVGFLVSCLDTNDVRHLLALWDRFRQPTKK
jgi:hypothetical protein